MKIALGFTRDDLAKVVWTFIQAAAAFYALQTALGKSTDKTLVIGAIAAGISAVKNFVLSDESKLK